MADSQVLAGIFIGALLGVSGNALVTMVFRWLDDEIKSGIEWIAFIATVGSFVVSMGLILLYM